MHVKGAAHQFSEWVSASATAQCYWHGYQSDLYRSAHPL